MTESSPRQTGPAPKTWLAGRRVPALTVAVVVAAADGVGYYLSRPQVIGREDGSSRQNGRVGLLPAEVDLGDQPWDAIVPLQFTFVNDGRSPVVIRSARSSCDCTVIERSSYEGRSVAPGDLLPLDVEFHTLKIPGLKRRRIDIVTDDGQKHAAVIDVNVVGSWELSSDFVDFGDIVLDEIDPLAAETVAFCSDTDQLTDVSVAGAPGIECVTSGPARGTREIAIRILRARLPVGQSSATVVAHTSCGIKPTGVIYVKARGIHNLIPTPSPILLVGSKPTRVSFADRGGHRLRIVSAVTPEGTIDATVLEGGTVEVRNPSGTALSEAVPLHVVDAEGRARVVFVSAL